MQTEELEKRLRLGEDTVAEFQGVVHENIEVDPGEVAKVLCALANTKGGHLLLGVEDDGTVTGIGTLKQAEALMRQVIQICQDAIDPTLRCTFERMKVQGAEILVVEVPGFSTHRTYRANGKYFVRLGDVSQETTRDELLLFLQSWAIRFDEQPVVGATYEDLDPDAVHAFLGSIEGGCESERWPLLLEALKCVDRVRVPTVTGILLLGRDPQRWLMDARITAAVFRGKEITSHFVIRKQMGGRLLEQLDAAAAFLQMHAGAPPQRIERVERGIPDKILREVILNALIHRDYRAAAQIRIYVFDDRIEIVNPGEFPYQLTLEGCRLGGISQRRNPVLASLLFRASRRENIGMSIPEMIKRMRERKLPEPEFTVGSGHFKVVLRIAWEAVEG